MAYKPLYINDNGTVRTVEQFHMNDNGTVRTIQEGYINDNGTIRHIYSAHPYPPGTDIFSYSWSQGGSLDITPYYNQYPEAFASAPYYTQGSGSADSRQFVEFAEGFSIYLYYQPGVAGGASKYNPDNDKGRDFILWMGRTVSGVERFDGYAGSGNGGTSITVRYFG